MKYSSFIQLKERKVVSSILTAGINFFFLVLLAQNDQDDDDGNDGHRRWTPEPRGDQANTHLASI